MVTNDDIRERFMHHPPSTERIVAAHEMIRAEFLDIALKAQEFLPECREKALVLTKLEEAMFWANAAVARTQSVQI